MFITWQARYGRRARWRSRPANRRENLNYLHWQTSRQWHPGGWVFGYLPAGVFMAAGHHIGDRVESSITMSEMPYTPPQVDVKAFNCPYCRAFAHQDFMRVVRGSYNTAYKTSRCKHCGKSAAWHDRQLIYPPHTTATPPHKDLPEDIKQDYREAQAIVAQSPRGAAALLRLCIQKLCAYLVEESKNLNMDIGNLVANGLPSTVQKALDTVRVVGNEAVHPGQLDLKDDPDTASSLFDLVNIITQIMITQPNEVDAMYLKIPEDKRKAIEDRDNNKK